MHRLTALCPDEVISGAVVNAELLETLHDEPQAVPGQPGSPPLSGPEPLSRAVERHITQFLAAHQDGFTASDIYDRVLAEVERPLIQMTLAATRGNQIKAAAMLGLNRNTLRKKIRDLELPVVRGIG